jgi:hypothetical protein
MWKQDRLSHDRRRMKTASPATRNGPPGGVGDVPLARRLPENRPVVPPPANLSSNRRPRRLALPTLLRQPRSLPPRPPWHIQPNVYTLPMLRDISVDFFLKTSTFSSLPCLFLTQDIVFTLLSSILTDPSAGRLNMTVGYHTSTQRVGLNPGFSFPSMRLLFFNDIRISTKTL